MEAWPLHSPTWYPGDQEDLSWRSVTCEPSRCVVISPQGRRLIPPCRLPIFAWVSLPFSQPHSDSFCSRSLSSCVCILFFPLWLMHFFVVLMPFIINKQKKKSLHTQIIEPFCAKWCLKAQVWHLKDLFESIGGGKVCKIIKKYAREPFLYKKPHQIRC